MLELKLHHIIFVIEVIHSASSKTKIKMFVFYHTNNALNIPEHETNLAAAHRSFCTACKMIGYKLKSVLVN